MSTDPRPVAPGEERYQPGHEPETLAFMGRRSAATHAPHFLPFIEPGDDILDVACGPGTITVDLAALVGADGTVTGVDQVDHQFDIGRRIAAERGLDNVTFRTADAYALPFDDQRFDRVFSNALLEHVADPQAIVDEFRRVLRPGGTVALATPDWDGFVFGPVRAGLYEACELYRQLQVHNGGNPTIGRHLGTMLEDAGFTGIDTGGRYENYADRADVGEYLAVRFDRWAEDPDVVKLIPADELRRTAQTFRDWVQLPWGLWAQCWIWATGTAP